MTAMLSSNELTSLYSQLETPVNVAEMLDRDLPLRDDEHFALTIALAEMPADEALLTIACCILIIASRISNDTALTSSLTLQANFILDDYAPHWLRRQASPSSRTVMNEWTIYMQEDLEALSDLLLLSTDIFGSSSAAAAEICTILQDQAAAHAEALDSQSALPENASPVAINQDNIIAFPITRRIINHYS